MPVVAFANNQSMAAEAASSSVIFTNPVRLNGNDRASSILVGHYFYGAGGAANRELRAQPQVSNDGVTWLDMGSGVAMTQVGDTPVRGVDAVNGAYLRFKFTLAIVPGGVPDAHVCFDVHVNLDKA